MSKVAAIQMTSGAEVTANLIQAEQLINQAAGAGASLIALPENFALMGKHDADKLAIREQPGQGPLQDFLADQAKSHGVWIVGGTIPLRAADPNKVLATCLLYNPDGEPVARYDKIHLFDVSIDGKGKKRYQESKTIEAGSEVIVADTPLGSLGLAVCYDLRFPELFRAMLDQSMSIIALPSAFTLNTGKAHWQTLVRARAVENLCHIIAPNQGGRHPGGRETFGHSMIVDPWGVTLACLQDEPGIAVADLDARRTKTIRRHFPAIEHRQLKAC